MLITEGEPNGLEEKERERLRQALELVDLNARKIMIPRMNIEAVAAGTLPKRRCRPSSLSCRLFRRYHYAPSAATGKAPDRSMAPKRAERRRHVEHHTLRA